MSNTLWLALALVGTFLTIFVIGVGIDAVLGERRRPLTLLKAHVGAQPEAVPNLREEQMQGSAMDRIIMPGATRAGHLLTRLTPFDIDRKVNQQLIYAGSPAGWDVERVVALKIVGAIAGIVVGVLVTAILPLPALFKVLVIVLFGLAGYTVPGGYIAAKASARQKEILRALSDTMDLLTISVEAGLGFDAALSQVTKNVPGALSEEIGRLLQEMQIGVSRADAFRHLGDRTDVPELNGFVLSMIQADLFGVSIANVLRAQSRELRQKRRQRAEEIAQKIPLKLLFPTIFFVLPALMAVILGPGVIRIYQTLFK